MKAQDLLAKLLKDGAIAVHHTAGPCAVAFASIDASVRRVVWCNMGMGIELDQHHFHRVPRYRRLSVVQEYLHVFVDGRPTPWVTFGPYLCWPELAPAYYMAKARWDARMRIENERTLFAQFIVKEIALK